MASVVPNYIKSQCSSEPWPPPTSVASAAITRYQSFDTPSQRDTLAGGLPGSYQFAACRALLDFAAGFGRDMQIDSYKIDSNLSHTSSHVGKTSDTNLTPCSDKRFSMSRFLTSCIKPSATVLGSGSSSRQGSSPFSRSFIQSSTLGTLASTTAHPQAIASNGTQEMLVKENERWI